MTKLTRGIAVAVTLCLLLTCFAGCKTVGTEVKTYSLPEDMESVSDGVVAENDRFEMEWNDTKKTILLRDKEDGYVWSTTPYDVYQNDEENAFNGSPITIEVQELETLSSVIDRAYASCVSEETVSAVKVENGIQVTYYFDEYKISIPVIYTLREDGLAVTLKATDIAEEHDYQLMNVTLAPFMCSIPNDDDDSFLLVPALNGALMYSDVRTDGTRNYSAEMYGVDAGRFLSERAYEEEETRMPIFGAKVGDHALMAIIEDNAEAVSVVAETGNKRTAYGNAAVKVNVRGYDEYGDKKQSHESTLKTRMSKNFFEEPMTVCYYPLKGKKASLSGMATFYQNYLKENAGLTKNDAKQDVYAVSLVGNVSTHSLAFGIPYVSEKSATTFTEALEIIKELNDTTGQTPAVQLKGYGTTGLDVGKVAGGMAFSSKSGTKKDYRNLTSYATENNIQLFTDFDMLRFSSSGLGLWTLKDPAKTASQHQSVRYNINTATRDFIKEEGSYFLTSRTKLGSLMNKLLKKTDKLGVTGVSLSTMGYMAYSDYASADYFVKGKTASETTAYLNKVKEAGHAVSTDNANLYAAMASDAVFNLNMEADEKNVLDVYVPFYQMVMRGYVPMYSQALNTATNYQSAVLTALAGGVGLGYTLLDRYNVDFAATTFDNLFNSQYSDWKDRIATTVKQYEAYYAAIDGAGIRNYRILDGGVTETTFTNGVVAYTNPSSDKATCPAGELDAYGFCYKQGGKN